MDQSRKSISNELEMLLQKREKEYRELYSLFRLMVDNMPDMIWAKNLNKEYIFANKAICDNLLSAKDTSEPIGKTDLYFAQRERDKYPKDNSWHTFGEICRDSDQITLDEGKAMQFDEFGNVKGKFLFLDVRKAPLYNEMGDVIGVVGSARDVTLSKKIEQELKNETQLRELLMEISSEFINIPLEMVDKSIERSLKKIALFVEADRSYIFEYNWYNNTCSNTHEWCNIDVDSQIDNLQNLSLDVMKEWVVAHKKGEAKLTSNVMELPEGEGKDVLLSQGIKSFLTVPLMKHDYCIGFAGFDSVKKIHNYTNTELLLLKIFAQMLSNVTLRKEIEKELIIAKERAEESDKLKTAFLQNINHEIRTPLNSIIGFSKLLNEESITKAEINEYTKVILSSSDKLVSIIGSVLDLSKIEANQIDVQSHQISINILICDLYSQFENFAKNKDLELKIYTPLSDEESSIFTDELKINQILSNLINNAIKFTHKGTIEFGYVPRERYIEFFVKDSGIGISEEFKDRIFNRFSQVDVSTTRGYEGVGLGLAICSGLVILLGGQIWYESTVSVGSTFYFTIPR